MLRSVRSHCYGVAAIVLSIVFGQKGTVVLVVKSSLVL